MWANADINGVRFEIGDALTDSEGFFSIKVRQIPTARHVERDVWTALKYGTGIAFYALWAIGTGDAIWRHQDQVVTETKEPINPATKVPAVRLNIYPTPGGLGAGLTIGF